MSAGMNSQQKLRLKQGASRAMKARIWHCAACERGQVGGKRCEGLGGEVVTFEACRYCGHLAVVRSEGEPRA